MATNLSRMVRERVTEAKPHSIMELEGLGAEIWQDIDVQAYVDQERASFVVEGQANDTID